MAPRAAIGTSILLTALFVLTAFAPASLGDREPNDSFAQSETIGPGDYTGHIGAPEDMLDTYAFTARANQRVYLNASANRECSVNVFDADQDVLENSFSKTAHRLTWDAGRDTTYYVKVEGGAQGTLATNYSISLVIEDIRTVGDTAGGWLSSTVFGIPVWLVLLLVVLILVVAAVASRTRPARPR